MESPNTKDLLLIAAPFIKTLVNTLITPKLKSFQERFALDLKKHYIPTDEHFREYFFRTYKKVSIINTLVFNNSQKQLREIFIPLTILRSADKTEKYKLKGFPERLFDKYDRILITDTAGMGKSTLMKLFFLDIIDRNLAIPIIIDLRRLGGEKKIMDEIVEQLNGIAVQFNSILFFELLNDGGFIFILDGFDEIPLHDKEFVTRDIQNLISKASLNKFIITSRPENSLTSFGDFQKFTIEPLKHKEAFELLRKYDNQGPISNLLIKKLQEQEMRNISEFLTNPLLVSLLFIAFEHKQTIPLKKHLFYRQVYDANFESHDLTKGDSYIHAKHSSLETDDFHRVLRHIGFQCLKLQKIEFTKDELLQIIGKSKLFNVGLIFSESAFLKDLLTTVPLFTQDGNYLRWSHKSLQEYFAAQFIYLDAKQKQATILNMIFDHSKRESFYNLLDLYYDIDFKMSRNVIIFRLLMEFDSFGCVLVQQASDNNKILQRWREILYSYRFFLFRYKQSNDFLGSDETREMTKRFLIESSVIDSCQIGPTKLPEIGYISVNKKPMQILKLLRAKKNALVTPVNVSNNEGVRDFSFLTTEFQPIEIDEEWIIERNGTVDLLHIAELLDNKLILNHVLAESELLEIKQQMKAEEDEDFLTHDL